MPALCLGAEPYAQNCIRRKACGLEFLPACPRTPPDMHETCFCPLDFRVATYFLALPAMDASKCLVRQTGFRYDWPATADTLQGCSSIG
ncbi:hypothetical protein FLP30_03715 [Acetobacter vaccinii]|uniref:Uncharacterized protein n=1 Tax=Acetobacter vaccinii TaxID=2592655 RepID=A0A5C1YLZ9_9PROT|nr:hypothetical protein FLP30_03715 [Acetobacter vaccinii]